MNARAKVLAMKKLHPDWGCRRLASQCGVSRARIRQILHPGIQDENPHKRASDPEDEVTVDLGVKSGTAVSISSKIKSVEDLLRYAEVDMTVWEVERCVVNKWEVGSKDADSKVEVTPLFQVKAWLRRKVAGAADCLKGLLAEFSSRQKPKQVLYRRHHSGNALEISICDPHHGKLAWGKETGEPYDLKISTRLQEQAMVYLLDISAGFKLEQILLVTGNDYFHTDNIVGTTTAGTRQDCDGRWQKQFCEGIKSMVDSIELARKVAPVTVTVVPGNHDFQTAFNLGEVLIAHFRNTPGVTVNNEPTARKYWQWGKCLLCLTHGNNEKVASLPLIMATEMPQEWAASKFREIHVGHHHRRMEAFFKSADEFNGVRYRALPSLSAADAWHNLHGYASIRAAEGFILNKNQGFIGNFSFSPA